MPRKIRIESREGIYHVINRGNYRGFVFESEGAKRSFETTLFEACERFGWELKAYALLSNHFHLCLGTPRGNLSDGMRWLQSTYATRFNRFRAERGHLFQGRFKALVVEPGASVIELVNYIHLNPVRAGLVALTDLPGFRWTSLAAFSGHRARPDFLDARWLSGMREGEDSPGGWQRYRQLLEVELEREPAATEELETAMTRGWCIGSPVFKQALAEDYFKEPDTLQLEHADLKEVNRLHWENLLRRSLEHVEKSEADIRGDKFSADWKLAIATKLRRESAVSNRWLSDALQMGAPNAVSNNCGRYQREREHACPWAKRLTNMKYES